MINDYKMQECLNRWDEESRERIRTFVRKDSIIGRKDSNLRPSQKR